MDKITKKIIGAGYQKRSGQVLIPKYFLQILGIEINSKITIECNKKKKEIIIRGVTDES